MIVIAAILSLFLQAAPPKTVVVAFETSAGNFEVAVDVAHAPITAANFLKYVDDGAYNNGSFHRTVRPDTEIRADFPIQVIQASVAPGSKRYPSIPLERTNVTGIHHAAGTLSMARATAPDSAGSDFFVCVTDTPALDYGGKRNPDGQGFAAFAHVIRGMDVIKQIHASPTSPDAVDRARQNLTPRITILKAYRK